MNRTHYTPLSPQTWLGERPRTRPQLGRPHGLGYRKAPILRSLLI